MLNKYVCYENFVVFIFGKIILLASPCEDKMRQECINEFIQTEKAYIDDMSIVHKVFEKPLYESRIVDKQDVEDIFLNWQEILECNQNFLKDLLNRNDSGSNIIGDVICSHVSYNKNISTIMLSHFRILDTKNDSIYNILQ